MPVTVRQAELRYFSSTTGLATTKCQWQARFDYNVKINQWYFRVA